MYGSLGYCWTVLYYTLYFATFHILNPLHKTHVLMTYDLLPAFGSLSSAYESFYVKLPCCSIDVSISNLKQALVVFTAIQESRKAERTQILICEEEGCPCATYQPECT